MNSVSIYKNSEIKKRIQTPYTHPPNPLRPLVLHPLFHQPPADPRMENPPPNKLSEIKSSPLPWVTANQPSRRAEIVLCRLRIGHTRLTHTHLISDLFPLSCHFCKTDISISVVHLCTCPALSSCRDSHLVPHDRKLALKNNHEVICRTLSYLRHIDILHLV